MFDIHSQRKIAVSQWLVKARWIYFLGVLIIGFLTKILSESNVNFSFASMFFLGLFYTFFNLFLIFGFRRALRQADIFLIDFLSWFQIIMEVLTLLVIMHMAGGVESISTVFFFLPVVSASLIFGAKGGVITAIFAFICVNSLVLAEFYGVIPHIQRYEFISQEFQSLPITLTKTITTGIFYIVVGFFSGYSSNLLFRREEMLEQKTKQLDEKSKLLSQREKKLSDINLKLFEAKNKISVIINNFSDPIIFIDSQKRLNLFNPACKKFLGFGAEDLGKTISDKNNFSMNNFSDLVDYDFKVKEVFDSSKEIFEEMEVDIENNKKVYKVITLEVKDRDDNYFGVVKVFYDMTREKMIDKMKSEFISVAAHQLRTPLTAIKWIIKMLLDGDEGRLNKNQFELLSKGYQSNERIIRLVNDLLNVSRIEEGRFGYKFKKTDFMSEVLEPVKLNSKQALAEKKQKLKINIPEEIPEIKADPERLILVVQNLLDNAIKYTPDGGEININVEIGKRYLRFNIKDSGVGIPQADQKKIFSKFFRAANVIRMETEGTGLGLFIAKNIIDKHGGDIYLNSTEGKGTEVGFDLPL